MTCYIDKVKDLPKFFEPNFPNFNAYTILSTCACIAQCVYSAHNIIILHITTTGGKEVIHFILLSTVYFILSETTFDIYLSLPLSLPPSKCLSWLDPRSSRSSRDCSANFFSNSSLSRCSFSSISFSRLAVSTGLAPPKSLTAFSAFSRSLSLSRSSCSFASC